MGIVVACGGSDSPSIPGDTTDVDAGSSLTEDRLISNPSGSYSMDDLVSVGFKKSKQFETDTLPARSMSGTASSTRKTLRSASTKTTRTRWTMAWNRQKPR
jgi:hypothetical protein